MKKRVKTVLVLANVTNLSSLKAAIESAEGVAVSKIYFTHKSQKTLAVYNQSEIPCIYCHCPIELADELLREGYNIISLVMTKTSRLLCEAEIAPKTAFIVSDDEKGVSQQLLNKSFSAHLPMLGGSSTLNAGMVAGIALYTAYFQNEQCLQQRYL